MKPSYAFHSNNKSFFRRSKSGARVWTRKGVNLVTQPGSRCYVSRQGLLSQPGEWNLVSADSPMTVKSIQAKWPPNTPWFVLQSESLYQKISWSAESGSLRGLQFVRVVINDNCFIWVWSGQWICSHTLRTSTITVASSSVSNLITGARAPEISSWGCPGWHWWAGWAQRHFFLNCCFFPPVAMVAPLEPFFPCLSTWRGGLALTWPKSMKQTSNCRLCRLQTQ